MKTLESPNYHRITDVYAGCQRHREKENSQDGKLKCECATLTAEQKHLAIMARIDALDLTRVKKSICLPRERGGEEWTQERADVIEVWYKRWLKLIVTNHGEWLSPSRSIDLMWHIHLLDSVNYFEDCVAIFGHYFHHRLDVGDTDDSVNPFYDRTNQLFLEKYGELPPNYVGDVPKQGYRPERGSLCCGHGD